MAQTKEALLVAMHAKQDSIAKENDRQWIIHLKSQEEASFFVSFFSSDSWSHGEDKS